MLIVVDQMRADYVERFQGRLDVRLETAGHRRRLVQQRRVSRISAPTPAPVTPRSRPARFRICTASFRTRGTTATARPSSRARTTRRRQRRLRRSRPATTTAPRVCWCPSFADEMRTQRSARVVTLSLKARSAIMLAGHDGDAVTWISDSLDGWQTSKAFAPAPVPAVQAFVAANPIDADFAQVWERLLPVDAYHDIDAGAGEAPPDGWTEPLSARPLKGDRNQPDERFREHWQASPFADAYLGRFAAAWPSRCSSASTRRPTCWRSAFRRPIWSATPSARAARKCRTCTRTSIARWARCSIGSTHWSDVTSTWSALSADHGVTDIPEQITARGGSAGRLTASAVAGVIERTRTGRARSRQVRRARQRQRRLLRTGRLRTAAHAGRRPRCGGQSARAAAGHRAGLPQRVSSPGPRPQARTTGSCSAAALSFVPRRSGDLVLATEAGLDVLGERDDARQREPRRPARAGDVHGRRHQARALHRGRDPGRHRADAGGALRNHDAARRGSAAPRAFCRPPALSSDPSR